MDFFGNMEKEKKLILVVMHFIHAYSRVRDGIRIYLDIPVRLPNREISDRQVAA